MAISVGAVVVVVLVGGQLVVPPIATTVLRHRLAKDGKVTSVRLSAFPWVKLLWQHADSITVKMASYSATPSQLSKLLHEGESVGTLNVSLGEFHSGLLTLHDVSFSKHGDEMVGGGRLELRDLQAALPIVSSLTPVKNAAGQLVLRGTASVLGVSATVDVVIAARDGKLVVAPTGLIGAFATVTLFDDPDVRVQSVSVSSAPGGLRFVVHGRAT